MVHLANASAGAALWSAAQYNDLLPARFVLVVEAIPESKDESPPPAEVAAFLVAYEVDSQWELENLVVRERFRRSGLGTRLLRELMGHAQAEQGSAIFLEVRESNQAARRLYEWCGFEKTGLRKNYYHDPAGHAVLYRRLLP